MPLGVHDKVTAAHAAWHKKQYEKCVKRFGIIGKVIWRLFHKNHPQAWMLNE